MATTAIVLGVLGAAAGGASAGIGASNSQGASRAENINMNFAPFDDPMKDPLLQAMRFASLSQLGFGGMSEQMLMQSSPLNQRINEIMRNPTTPSLWKTIMVREAEQDPKLKVQEEEYRKRIKGMVGQMGNADIFGKRVSALERLGNIASPGGTDSLLALTRRRLSEQREDQFGQARDRLLSEANAGGYNPAGIMAELEKERFRSSSSNELEARTQALGLGQQEAALIDLFLNGGQSREQAGVASLGSTTAAGIAARQQAAADVAKGPGVAASVLDSVGSSLMMGSMMGGMGGGGGSGAKPAMGAQAWQPRQAAWD